MVVIEEQRRPHVSQETSIKPEGIPMNPTSTPRIQPVPPASPSLTAHKMIQISVLPAPPAPTCIPFHHLLSSLPSSLLSRFNISSHPNPRTMGIIWLTTLSLGNTAPHLRSILEQAPNVKFVQLPMTGVDEYLPLMRAMEERGIVWCGAGGCYGGIVAEHALALVLALLRGLNRSVPFGRGEVDTLLGKRVVVVGAGSIGSSLCRLLDGLRCDVTTIASATSHEELVGALRTAQVVFLACPLTPHTQNLFDKLLLQTLPPGAILINVARGEIVHSPSLLSTLQNGHLKAAALDVITLDNPDQEREVQELVQQGKLIVTDHSAIPETMVADLLGERIRRNLEVLVGESEAWEGRVDVQKGY